MIIKNIDGLLFIDKPKGITSNKCLQYLKTKLNISKAGFIGTLDPLATGILPICLGEATKFSQFLQNTNKCYLVEVKLGISTNTFDAEGTIIKRWLVNLKFKQILSSLQDFIGTQYQIPPHYSAVKYKGISAYKYARNNIVINLKPKKIYIYSIKLIQYDYHYNIIKLLVHCSKGTYIRSLINDLGNKLMCGAYVVNLRRIRISVNITQNKLITLSQLNYYLNLNNNINKFLYPIDNILSELLKINLINHNSINKFMNGHSIIYKNNNFYNNKNNFIRIYAYNLFLGIGKLVNNSYLIPIRLIKNFNKKDLK